MGALSKDQVAVWKRLFQEAGMSPE
jgi:hypothetical protein